jgi:3-deoxy-D-manno-octulosonic-acid transferase
MIPLYRILSTLAAFFVLPGFAAYSWITGKKRRGLAHHFGGMPWVKKESHHKTLWVHALSLGEVNAAAPVLKRIRQESPDVKIVVTVTTDSGYDGAQRLIEGADYIFYHPLDCWPFLKLAVSNIQPDLFVLTDTGFWPGLLWLLQERGTPMLVFNGRVSTRSFKRYKRFKPVVQTILSSFETICMQNAHGVEAMKALGADPDRVKVIGDTKYDALQEVHVPERQRIHEKLKIPSSRKVWVAGSTHAGEEEILLDAFQKLRRRHPELTLVLAPRRMERVPEVARLIEQRKLDYALRSDLAHDSGRGHAVLVLDTMGELARVYAIADVAFVGHSLIAPGGGHSLIEPVAHGKVVLHGPYVENVRQSADDLKAAGVAFEVKDAETLEESLHSLLNDPTRQAQLSDKAKGFVQNKKGAAREMARIINSALNHS